MPDMSKYVKEGYEPKFERTSTERRVLGFITPEVDTDALGPRNSFAALDYALNRDDETHYAGNQDQLQGYLADLVKEGLAKVDAKGVYSITKDGLTELVN